MLYLFTAILKLISSRVLFSALLSHVPLLTLPLVHKLQRMLQRDQVLP